MLPRHDYGKFFLKFHEGDLLGFRSGLDVATAKAAGAMELMQTMQTRNCRILTYMYGGVGGRRKMSITKEYEEVIGSVKDNEDDESSEYESEEDKKYEKDMQQLKIKYKK